ncbi:ABC transporter substrate-binding protein [Paenibacillus daejeonensis]|uniref:ABC transporter substrate-binding protein n=1 Tax=Paenibacillus daejeonensis TaxID=135193 RepID=UPI00035FB9A0|nr:ABC transporter substrate-binding protein [Paenibacillus daejeonensis]
MRQLGIVYVLLLVLLLAACGGGQSGNNAASPEAPADSEVRTISHMMGDTEVPAKIERPVVLSAAYADHLLTIGEKPYGINVEARYGGDYPPYLEEQLAGTALVGSADEPNLEAILELDPDVILIESRTAESTYDELSKIAPTLVLGHEWLAYEDDPTAWTLDLLKIAELYGKEDLAREKIEQLELKTAEARLTIEALDDKRMAYLRVREKTIQIYAAKGHPMNTLLYHDLGFEPASLTPEEQREDLSLEVVSDLDASIIFLEVDPNGLDNLASMRESALWAQVPAVAEEGLYETDSFWLFKGWGAIGREAIIDDILSWLS